MIQMGPLVLTNAGTGQPGPPCVADFDGDGTAELAWASSSRFNVYELDGTVLWAQTVADASGLAACSGYDVNGDGAYEILFADENTFYIFDGSTGAVLFSQGGHASGTIFEYPIVADIDNDDSAEIIISSNNFRFGGVGWAGITVFGHLGDGWAKSGPTWNVHDFAVTNIYSDGSVPLSPEPPWQLYNVYRARPTEDASAIDLKAEIVEICYAGCDPESIVRVAGQPINVGPSSVRANIPLSLYRKDGNAYTFLASALTTDQSMPAQRGLALSLRPPLVASMAQLHWSSELMIGGMALAPLRNATSGTMALSTRSFPALLYTRIGDLPSIGHKLKMDAHLILILQLPKHRTVGLETIICGLNIK